MAKKASDITKFTPKTWVDIGERLVGSILQRTFVDGKDWAGKRFKKYSDSYREFRQKKGRNTNTVDLTFTAKTRRNLRRRRTTKSGVELGWNQRGNIIESQEDLGRTVLKPKTGLSKSEEKIVEEGLGRFVDKQIRKYTSETVTVKI